MKECSQPQAEVHSEQMESREALCERCRGPLGERALEGEGVALSPEESQFEQEDSLSLKHRMARYERPTRKDPLDSVPILKVAGRDTSQGFTVIQGRVPIKSIRFDKKRSGKKRPKPHYFI
ncbi:MAG: hypothetical protein Q4F02_00380 [Candidatus Saccharibacteria bacterium]|nr:hypothetical protein [Candidatus Saccharibacteria bacterium]